MIINNEQFNEFLQDKNQRQYSYKTAAHRYNLFKVAYDEDCDFIQIMQIYTYHNPEGKPSLNDKTGLGGIYIYSSKLFFNLSYDMRNYVCNDNMKNDTLSVKDYYKYLCSDISTEIIQRVESGQFDRTEAKKLVAEDDRDIEYYNKYRESDSVERTFLEGKPLDKPDICISYHPRCEYDIEAVLRYLRSPAEIIDERVANFMEENKVMIYKQIIRAEIQFEELQKLEADKGHPLHYKREIQRIIGAACVKTVNVTFEREGQSITVKMTADRLSWSDTVSDWNVLAVDRSAYNKLFGYTLGGDARLEEITLITHGKKELYNKAAFDKILKEKR